jgi:hypothetical protein
MGAVQTLIEGPLLLPGKYILQVKSCDFQCNYLGTLLVITHTHTQGASCTTRLISMVIQRTAGQLLSAFFWTTAF